MENETLKQYYINTNKEIPDELKIGEGRLPHLNIILQKNCFNSLAFMRRDYYKIVLTKTRALLKTANGEILIDRPALFFSSPDRLFGWTYLCESQWGYTILFNDLYLHKETKDAFRSLFSLFSEKEYPFLFLEEHYFERYTYLFQLIFEEYQSGFVFKDYLINNLLVTVVYTAIKIKNGNLSDQEKGKTVFTNFCSLLERQFPIDAPNVIMTKNSPKEFALALGIHVNYLNSIVKKETSKTTSEVISNRILLEAINLLKHSNWTITEIANSLGYSYAQHFHHFFKGKTGVSPKDFRNNI